MMSARDFNVRLVRELGRYRPFTLYWSDALLDCVPEGMRMSYEPRESISFFQKVVSIPLQPRASVDPALDRTLAHCDVIFTSLQEPFDFDCSLYPDESCEYSEVNVVIVTLRISDEAHHSLAQFRKKLWSSDPPHVEGVADYVKAVA